MKKLIIIAVVIILLIFVGWLIMRPNNNSTQLDTNQLAPTNEITLTPFEVTIGLYEPAEEQSQLTTTLESRLKEIGFKVEIIHELVDPAAADNELTTLLYRTNAEDAADLIIQKLISSTLYRKGLNEAVQQDVIISAWNIGDINWGSFAQLADKLNNPDPATISVAVINAGAADGAAGKIVELLQDKGYSQVVAQNVQEGEPPADKPVIIYYQRNFKNTAKALRAILVEAKYPDTSYRINLAQESDIIVVLGPEEKPIDPADTGLKLDVSDQATKEGTQPTAE